MSRNWADRGQGREEDFSRHIFLYLLILNDKIIILIYSISGISVGGGQNSIPLDSANLFHFHIQSN